MYFGSRKRVVLCRFKRDAFVGKFEEFSAKSREFMLLRQERARAREFAPARLLVVVVVVLVLCCERKKVVLKKVASFIKRSWQTFPRRTPVVFFFRLNGSAAASLSFVFFPTSKFVSRLTSFSFSRTSSSSSSFTSSFENMKANIARYFSMLSSKD